MLYDIWYVLLCAATDNNMLTLLLVQGLCVQNCANVLLSLSAQCKQQHANHRASLWIVDCSQMFSEIGWQPVLSYVLCYDVDSIQFGCKHKICRSNKMISKNWFTKLFVIAGTTTRRWWCIVIPYRLTSFENLSTRTSVRRNRDEEALGVLWATPWHRDQTEWLLFWTFGNIL